MKYKYTLATKKASVNKVNFANGNGRKKYEQNANKIESSSELKVAFLTFGLLNVIPTVAYWSLCGFIISISAHQRRCATLKNEPDSTTYINSSKFTLT